MPYEKPKCECGGELYFYQELVYTLETKINKNGLRNKRPIKNQHGQLGSNWERLQCEKCPKEWNFTEDSKGRIVSGLDWWESNNH